MEEALKSLKIVPNILARRSRALWDLLMSTEEEEEEEAKNLAGCVLNSKTLRHQTEYRVPIELM